MIEDEPITRMDAVLLLEEAGFEVKEFVVVEKAMAFLESKAAIVIFVFTDVHTPGKLDGITLPSLPAIVGRGSRSSSPQGRSPRLRIAFLQVRLFSASHGVRRGPGAR